MKEIKDIIQAYDQLDKKSIRLALATVIYVAGSSYRRTGARMLVQDNGTYTGGISGGCLEGDALKKANYCLARNKTELVRYDTTKEGEDEIGVGLGCNGIIDVLLTPIDTASPDNPVELLRSCINDRATHCLITIVSSDREDLPAGKMFRFDRNNNLSEELSADAIKALQSNKSVVKTYEDFTAFIEIIPPALRVVLFGYGYDVYPLLRLGKELGWEMCLSTNPLKAAPAMKSLASSFYPTGEAIPVDDYTAYVLMAHDYNTDKNNLSMALHSNVPYIGMLGPLKRRAKALEELEEEGQKFSAGQLERLYNPVGLDIGATSPEEIALAILSEIRAHFSGKNGGFLRLKRGPIHQRE